MQCPPLPLVVRIKELHLDQALKQINITLFIISKYYFPLSLSLPLSSPEGPVSEDIRHTCGIHTHMQPYPYTHKIKINNSYLENHLGSGYYIRYYIVSVFIFLNLATILWSFRRQTLFLKKMNEVTLEKD